MADEIKLKAPTVEQQVVVNINGEDKLKSFADTLDKISNNKNLQKYWKTQQDLINATTDAYNNFQKKASKDNASELIKITNALKAMSGTDLSHILPDFDKISKGMVEAQKVAGNIDSAFSVKGFKEAFDSFETLEAYGTDIQKLFSHFGVSSDIGELQQNVRLLESEVEKLTRKLSNARNANEELRNEFENFKVGSGFADKLDELDRLKAEMQNIRDEATQTFNQFLDVNKIDRYDWFNNDRFAEYFEKLENGTLTASEAIRQFKTEYGYLLEESFKSNGNSFGLDQLQAFSAKFDSIFQQVEETSNKINDILSNGVIAKSVQNLSEDTTLSDSQRSIFGNIFQDEEALKSVTALFQKLIDETNQAKNTEIFNTEQFTKLESLFTSIESSLSSIKGVLVDVGDGEELSPLLKTIANIESAIDNLSSSVKGIGLNMNIDFGSDTEMEAKAQAKISNALQAYQRLFEHIKMSSAGGSIINTKFFDFDINQFDTPMSKLQAYRKFIENMRNEAKAMYGGQDIIFTDTDKKYWIQASSAMGQVTKTFNEMKAASDTNPLENIFGKTDLSGVIEQLNTIVSKLDEISDSAKGFTEAFKDGLNVNASVEEVEKLTNRVKELEDELAKVKTPTTVATSQESNISSGMKDAFPDSSTDTKPETESMEQVEKATEEAVQAKKEFATANEGVQSSIDGSENPLKLEAELMEQIAKSAREAADAKKEFVEANKQVEKSADDSNSELKDTPKKDKYAKRNKISEDDFLNDSSKYTSIANSRLISSGNTILGNTVNADLVDGLVKVTAKIKDADGVWKTFSARIDADGNMFNQRFKAITKGVNQLEDDLKKFGKDKVKSDLTDIQIAKYQELENAIKNYEKISKRIASNSAYDGDEKSASDLLDTINEIMGKTNGGITVLSNEQLNKAQNKLDNIDQTISDIKQKTNISEFKNLEKLQSSAINKLNPYTNDTKYTIDFINKVNNLQEQIANFNLSNQSDVDRLKAIDAEIKNIIKESNLLENKRVKQKSNLAEIVSQMKIFKSQNTNMSRSQKAELDQIINYAETMQRSGEEVASEVENIKVRFAGLKAEVNETGKAGKNFFSQIRNRLTDMNSKFIAQFLSWQDWIMYIRQAAEMVTELNTQITELAKVSEDSVSQIYADFDSYANIAKEMGSTISDTIAATTAWSKNGYNIPDSKKLAEVSLLYKNVGDGINVDEANESLVSTLKGFKLEADQAEHIVDVLNEVSNNEAISSSGIGEALQRSAASFNAANTSLEKSVALVTATNSVLQDPEKVGNMWKTVSARIRGAKSELAEMGEDTDDMVESTSKLRDLVKGITGFDIMKDENTFKDIYDIIIGISEKWNTLSDIDQASLLENLAGKNQSNALAAALSNVDLLKKSYEEATNAEGSAREEQEKYTKSIKYSIDKAKASLEELANDFLSSDFLKGLIDFGEKIISFLDKIIDKFGVLPTLLTAIGTALSFKNVGIDTLVAY